MSDSSSPQAWSHYGIGDSRCDKRPTFVDWARAYECRACERNRSTRWVFTETYAAYMQILNFAPPRRPEVASLDIPGFMQIGPHTYRRIADPQALPPQWAAARGRDRGVISWRTLAVIGLILLLAVVCR